MGAEAGQLPSNQDLYVQMEGLERRVNEKFASLDTKIDRNQRDAEQRFATQQMLGGLTKTITNEVVREVTTQLHDIIADGVRTVGAEIQHNANAQARDEFRVVYREERASEREDRKQDIKEVFGKPRLIAVYLTPLFQFVIAAAAVWFLIQRFL